MTRSLALSRIIRLLLPELCLRLQGIHCRLLAEKSESCRARNRCCFVLESDRKPDLRSCPVRVFGPFLPHLSSCPRQYHHPKGGTLMGSKIYVGGLPYSATYQQLSDLFTAHGSVDSARVIADKFTGQSLGFG